MNFKNNIYSLFTFIPVFIILILACSEKSTIEHLDHTEAIGMIIYYNNQILLKVLNGKIDTTISKELSFVLNVNYSPIEIKFIDEEGDIITPEEEGKSFSWALDDSSLVEINFIPDEKWKIAITGVKVGTINIQFSLNHYDHPDFRTPILPLKIVDR